MIVHKLNESYSVLDDKLEILQKIHDYLRVERPGAFFEPLVKAGMKSPYNYFASVQNQKLLVMNGHLQLLAQFGVQQDSVIGDYTEQQVEDFLIDVKTKLPFPPYDFQEKAFKESILNVKQINKMCTGSGKSLTISLIAEFFRKQGRKGLLLVPNINLLTQFKNDIKDYNLIDLYNDTHTIGGGNSDKHFNNSLTISTWQSMMHFKDELNKLDYVITDECLAPNTLVKTINGDIQIKNIKKGDLVLTLNEKTNQKEFKPVEKLHKNLAISRKEKMFRITLENGEIIEITGNHKVNTKDGWKRADELTIEDDIISL